MKILILSNSDMGLYKFRSELIKELIKNHDVFICVPEGNFINKLKDFGCTYISCNFLERHGKNPLKEIELFLFYRKLIKKIKPDIVLTYTIKSNIWGGIACRSLNLPYIVNITGLGTAVENKGFLQKITIFLYKIAMKRSQKIFFQNTENKDFMLKNNIVKDNYEILPGSGVNLKEYRLLEYPNENIINFAFIARIMKEKGIEEYIKMAVYIKKKYPNTNFHIYGYCEQNYETTIEQLEKKGIVIYHGLVDNMLKEYEKISCVIHPTYYPEGLSNVLLESCACGRPIITTNRSGCREVVDDEKNGFIIEEKNSIDLIAKVEIFLNLSIDKKRQMGVYGRKKVEKNFDRNIVVAKYLKELGRIKKYEKRTRKI